MIDPNTWKMAWSLLDAEERKKAYFTLVAIIIGAISAAGMVGSIMPFLAVMSNPSIIHRNHYLSWAYNNYNFESDYKFLLALGYVSFLIIVLSILLQIIKNWSVLAFSMSKLHSISYRLIQKYLSQPYEFYLTQNTAELSSKVLVEVERAVTLFFRPAVEFVASCFTIITIVSLLIWVNPIIALGSFLIFGSIYALISYITRLKLKKLGELRFEQGTQKFKVANEAFYGIKDIKLLGREREYIERFDSPSSKEANALIKTYLYSSIPSILIQTVAIGGMLLLCMSLINNTETLSDNSLGKLLPLLGVFALAGQRLLPELTKMYGMSAEMQASAPIISALYKDLTIEIRNESIKNNDKVPLGLKKCLKLKNISYRYPQTENSSVRNITVDIIAGEKVGIVGSSGSGKTTLVDIILGLLIPEDGCIFIDDVRIDDRNLHSWKNSVGYVQQDIFLTDASIAENIALGLWPHQIDYARVEEAAVIANIDKFIMNELPNGYYSQIGERGVRLSGGQRQRIGIARALYHDADLIVFDEATSALDNITEKEVIDSIDALPGDKTVIMIAHRLSTVRHCDKIIVIEKGQIIGYDSWDKLIVENNTFKKIAKSSKMSNF